MGLCCYRTSNAARHDAPQYRIAALDILQPITLGSVLIRGLMNGAIDEERFNWLFSVTGAAADGDVTLETGFGKRNADATFSFASGDATAPGDANRWDPQTLTGTLAGESISAPALAGTFTVAMLNADGSVALELPLQAFEVVNMSMTEMRSCLGNRRSRSYCTDDASLQAFITIGDAQAGVVDLPPINTSLSNFIRGKFSYTGDCMTDTDPTTGPPAGWTVPPDARCAGGICTETCTPGADLSDASTCNAWKVLADFAGQGVTIN